MNKRLQHNLISAWEGIISNRFRALLTSLGMIFGVAAVIAMLAIGKGTEQQILEQLKEVGSNNIIIKGLDADEIESIEEEDGKATPTRTSPGLRLPDFQNIQVLLPNALVSAIVEDELELSANGKQVKGTLRGVHPALFSMRNIDPISGSLFTNAHVMKTLPVCVINQALESRLFEGESALHRKVKIGHEWFDVVGVISNEQANSGTDFFGSTGKYLIYTPVTSFLTRVGDPSLKTSTESEEGEWGSSVSVSGPTTNHQLKRILVQVPQAELMASSAEILERLFERRHNEVKDVQVIVPQLLLQQQQKTKRIFSLVLGLIAGISLLVGGIGIMNIMLATVYERIREIGLRLSIGAKQKDVVIQFLGEAVLICVSGGVIGIVVGLLLAQLVELTLDIQAVVSIWSVVLAFSISVVVGVLFGWYPARKAASQNPIESMRHD
jgi:putative ABC transport system permease protein